MGCLCSSLRRGAADEEDNWRAGTANVKSPRKGGAGDALAGLYRGADEYLRASKALSRDFELRETDTLGIEQIRALDELNEAAAAAWAPRCVDTASPSGASSSSPPTLRRLEPTPPPAVGGALPVAACGSPGDEPPLPAAEVQAPPPAAEVQALPLTAELQTPQMLPPDEVQALLETLPPRPDEVPATALRPQRRLARCHESMRWFPVKGCGHSTHSGPHPRTHTPRTSAPPHPRTRVRTSAPLQVVFQSAAD